MWDPFDAAGTFNLLLLLLSVALITAVQQLVQRHKCPPGVRWRSQEEHESGGTIIKSDCCRFHITWLHVDLAAVMHK